MATKINDIEYVKLLRDSLTTCSFKSLEHLTVLEEFLEDKMMNLQSVLMDLEHRLTDADTKLNNRNNMLTLCNSRIEYDQKGNRKQPNCSSEENAVQRARTEQKAARKNVDEMKQILTLVNSRIIAYEKSMERFTILNTGYTKSCENYLNQLIALFNNYTELSNEYENI